MIALAHIVAAIIILDVGFLIGAWWTSDARRYDEADR